ncbi:hypothetical protein AALO_G00271880 [Alosa alosa]|uniref:Transglutaminase-like domain-containing protein n=1 Tax=Alosa alosa TaxID=278164 RepID=A0AAV6FMG9_9TELE|nr:uncharacterized protein LOC125286373 [Alosa alosa]KAG5264078.1 hypothetical protein AALO_G00271880 [Alosa alosa]
MLAQVKQGSRQDSLKISCCITEEDNMGNVIHLRRDEPLKSKRQILSDVDIQVRHHNNNNRNNSNNTKVTEEPFPLTKQQTVTQEEKGGLQAPKRASEDPADDTSPTSEEVADKSVIKQAWRLEVGKAPSGKKPYGGGGITTSPPPPRPSGVTAVKSAVFQKWASMDRDHQRPLAKRQLSDESKASATSCRVKKNSVKRDLVEVRQMLSADTAQTRQTESSGGGGGGRPRTALKPHTTHRKLQKDFLPSTDVFQKVDVHAIKAGKELRSKKIYSVEMIAQAITEGAQTDLQKLRAIWIWLCHNIEYDVSGYLGLTKKVTSPEQVIETGRGVCCGYSSVLQQMCREVGIECEEVSGHGKGVGYRQGQTFQNTKSSHMWNAVHLEGHWYLLDSCWGAGRVDLDNKAFIKRYDDFYFLTDPENFINSHCPDEAEWQLLNDPISLDEFEKRVLKTSEFYRLGLTLVHPKHFLLVTENGEATISMSYSQPLDFTYQASLHSGTDQKEPNASIGILTVTTGTMKLKLMPPVCGTFGIMVFARPANATGTFSWVCSFLLECPEPAPVEELPENPFLSWGLQQNATSLGLKPCKYGSDAMALDSGSFELVLHTTRPVMMLCELTHRDLDKTLAKRCLATQIEPNQLTCHVLCPYIGYYRLSVFVRDYESVGDPFQNAGNFLLRCTGGAINLNELFPANLSATCGPGVRTLNAGLSKFSHATAQLVTQQGKCNITFNNSQDLELHAVLAKDHRKRPGYPLSRHVFFTHNGSKVTISVALPEPGVYKLSLYGKAGTSAANQDFNLLCDFVLRSSSETSWPPFPCGYTAWQRGSVLFEPRSGLLEPGTWVRFRVRVPGAQRVSVQGEQRVELQLNKSRVWEGEVFTGNSATQLKLATAGTAGCGGGSNNNMAIVMSFDVLTGQNEL